MVTGDSFITPALLGLTEPTEIKGAKYNAPGWRPLLAVAMWCHRPHSHETAAPHHDVIYNSVTITGVLYDLHPAIGEQYSNERGVLLAVQGSVGKREIREAEW